MYFILFITLNLYWRLYQCANVTFDINVVSLIEFDENDNQVLSNTYTQFTANDWINATLFTPILSNNGHLEMSISPIPQNNEFQYTIDIHNWPWDNENNSIQFCFHIIIINGNDLQFQCSNKVFIKMKHNTMDICHRFHYNEQIDIAHIYYSAITNTEANYNTKYYSTTNDNLTLIDQDQNAILMRTNSGKYEYILWIFGVSMTISIIICIFISLICYLTKQGFFDDTPKRYKRKKSTIIIGNGGYIHNKCSSTQSADTNSLPTSPKKNLRINVEYHSPREREMMNKQNTNNLFVNDMQKMDKINANNIPNMDNNNDDNNNNKDEHSKTATRTFTCDTNTALTHTRTNTKTKTNTMNSCDTIRIIDAIMEGNEEDEIDSDNSNNSNVITPIVANQNNEFDLRINGNPSDNEFVPEFGPEFDHESSLIQYIITCSNNKENQNNELENEHSSPQSPVPFI